MTKAQDMGKDLTKRRLPPFVAMLWDVLNGKAFKALPPTAGKMLPYFLGKVQLPGNFRDPQYYRTHFTFTYTEGQSYGCSRKTFYEVLRALMRYGFIDPVKRGGLRGYSLTSSVFKLSDRWKHYGTATFVEVQWEAFGAHQLKDESGERNE